MATEAQKGLVSYSNSWSWVVKLCCHLHPAQCGSQNKVLLGQCFLSFNVLKKSSGVMGRSPDFEIPPPELLMQTVWRRAKESAL